MSKPAAVEKPNLSRQFVAGAAFLFVLTVVIYASACRGGFLWDDDVLITENPLVRQNDGLKLIWFSTQPHDYFPLTLTMFWFEWRLWDMDTTGYHVINMLLHAIGAVLLWRVLRQLRIPGALAGAAIFAAHPVCVASVAWIAERKNTLSLVFFLLAALYYLKSEAAPPRGSAAALPCPPLDRKRYVFSLFFFLCALLSKTSVVMLPVVLLGCAWWRHGRIGLKDVVRTSPFFLLSLGFGLLTIWFQTHRAIGGPAEAPLARIAGGGWAIWFYLWKTVFPVNLSMIYPRWEIQPSSAWAWLPWIAWIALAGVLWRFRRAWGRPLLFALGYFFIMLLPVLGVFNMSFFAYSRVADHLQYLSVPGIAALVGSALAGAWRKGRGAVAADAGFIPATGIVVVLLCIASFKEAQRYVSSERLWSSTLRLNPKAWVAYNNLGEALASEGEIEKAVEKFQSALRLKPDYVEALNNLGSAYSDLRRFEDAEGCFENALQIRPDYAVAENNWGLAMARSGKIAEAEQHFANALKLSPEFADARYNLALVFSQQGLSTRAIDNYRQVLQSRPDHLKARLNLGYLLNDLERSDEAIAEFNVLLQQDRGFAEAYNGLGMAMVKKNDYENAVVQFSEAVRIDPENLTALSNLGQSHARQGRIDEALSAFEQALRIAPDNPSVHVKVGTVFYDARNFELALAHFEAALNADPRNASLHYHRGMTLARLGRREDAIMALNEAIRIKPGYPEARQQLQMLGGAMMR